MTVMTSPTLSEACQSLIDARLDTIDRMLMGRVPRSDRSAIVGEIESQIHELLAAHNSEIISRDDVLNVLGRLDPPEAYLTNEDDETLIRPRQSTTGSSGRPDQRGVTRRSENAAGRIGGIVGISTLATLLLGLPIGWFIAASLDSILFLYSIIFLTALIGLVGSITGLVLSIRGRSQGILPIFGITTSAIALLVCLGGSGFVLLELLIN
jgi:hypothetical protein